VNFFYQSSKNINPAYRFDIDGLRAIAITAVLTYHIFPNILRGGFIGVDVFFVISGFLISTNIISQLDNGKFNFFDFYVRRVNRIFPALIIVLTACIIFGWILLLPDEYKQLGKHILSGATFTSNFILWNEAGYFNNSSLTKPLLHLWSLGIEEQFYILWPLLAVLIYKFKLNFVAIIISVILVSFSLNLYWVGLSDISSAFYLPQARLWELLSGGLLAWLILRLKSYPNEYLTQLLTKILGRAGATGVVLLREILSIFGFLLLVLGVFVVNEKYFPGWWSLIPVFGTLLIIVAGTDAWVNRIFLSSRPMVLVGLISYPLYLWHWPLLSFVYITEGHAPSVFMGLIVAFLSFFLAFLTYDFIEKPLKYINSLRFKSAILMCLLISMGCIGFSIYKGDGLLFRFSNLAPDLRLRIDRVANAWKSRGYQNPEGSFNDKRYEFLRIGKKDSESILFIGDSHMVQYWGGIAKAYKNSKINPYNSSVMFASLKFPPLIDINLASDPSIKTVIFSYFWALDYQSDKVARSERCCGNGKNGRVGTNDHPYLNEQQLNSIDQSLIAAAKLFRSHGKRVYFLLDNPFGSELDPQSMLLRSWSGFFIPSQKILTRKQALGRSEPIRSRIINAARQSDSMVIDPFAYLCNDDTCPAFSPEGELLYKDYDHLSVFASSYKTHYLDVVFLK